MEAVAEAGVGVDEAAVREHPLQLSTQLADVNVDGAIARTHRSSPDRLVEVVARDDRARPARKRDEQGELADRKHQRLAACEREPLIGPDLQLADVQGAVAYGQRVETARAVIGCRYSDVLMRSCHRQTAWPLQWCQSLRARDRLVNNA